MAASTDVVTRADIGKGLEINADFVEAKLGTGLSFSGTGAINAQPETVTTLVDNGNGTYTYTNENGVATIITVSGGGSETITQINNTVVGHKIADYSNEAGSTKDINETVTTLVDNGDGTYTYTNENGVTTVLTIGSNTFTNASLVDSIDPITGLQTLTFTDNLGAQNNITIPTEVVEVMNDGMGGFLVNSTGNPPNGSEGKIYLDKSNGYSYVYDNGTGSLKRLDNDKIVYGSLQSETVFGATDPTEVVDVVGKLYVDTITGKSYYWEGTKYARLDNESSVVYGAYNGTAFTPANASDVVDVEGKTYVDTVSGLSYYYQGGFYYRLDKEVYYGTYVSSTEFNGAPTNLEGNIYVDTTTGKSYYWNSTSSTFKRLDNEAELLKGTYDSVSGTFTGTFGEDVNDYLIFVDTITNKSYISNGVGGYNRIDNEVSVVLTSDIINQVPDMSNLNKIYIHTTTNKSYRYDGSAFVRLDNEPETLTTFNLSFDCNTFEVTGTYVDEVGATTTKVLDLSCLVGGMKVPVADIVALSTIYTPCFIEDPNGNEILAADVYVKSGFTLPISAGDMLYNSAGVLRTDIKSIGQGRRWVDETASPLVLQADNGILYPEQLLTREVKYGVVGKLNGSGC